MARLTVVLLLVASVATAQEPPELTQPVNDFAGVIDPSSEQAIDSLIRSLERASGDIVVVTTVNTFAPYGDIREYANEMFENHGRGIGQRRRDNGLLIVVAVMDRQVWVEVGYDLEEFITDGFAGETSRQHMVPAFRRGEYGPGLLAGATRIIGRIAERRNVTLEGVPRVEEDYDEESGGFAPLVVMLILVMIANAIAGRTRRRRRRGILGPGGSGGWHSGVGSFGGGFGGGGGGGGGW